MPVAVQNGKLAVVIEHLRPGATKKLERNERLGRDSQNEFRRATLNAVRARLEEPVAFVHQEELEESPVSPQLDLGQQVVVPDVPALHEEPL